MRAGHWTAMARATRAYAQDTRRIGMCGYTAVPENGRTRCIDTINASGSNPSNQGPQMLLWLRSL